MLASDFRLTPLALGKAFLKAAAISIATAFAALCAGEPPQENIALGKKYELAPAPNYSYGGKKRDASMDLKALTDGALCAETKTPWTQDACVGWSNIPYAKIVVDLGRTEPISSVAFHTAFDGALNVKWPSRIDVFAGDDGKLFRKVCELVDPRWADGFPAGLSPWKGQAMRFHEYRNDSLAVSARYVAFVVIAPKYTFCDEVKVFRGAESASAKPDDGKALVDIDDYMRVHAFDQQVKSILKKDLEGVRRNAAKSGAQERFAPACLAAENEILSANFTLPSDPSYRAIAPLNGQHRSLFRLNAEVMRLKGLPPLLAWSCNRWAPLNATDIPETSAAAPSLAIDMMADEFRAEAVNFTNSSPDDMELKVSFSGLPGGSAPGYLSPCQVEFVGMRYQMIADPLVDLEKTSGGYLMKIPSGMTRQLWIACNSKGVAPGTYKGALVVKGADGAGCEAPFTLKIRDARFPARPHLSLGMWDYTTGSPAAFEAITDSNRALAIKDMKAHYVDTAWARNQAACWPAAADFDKDGNLVAPLRTKAFDKWLEEFQDYKSFFIYLGADGMEKFAGEPVGTARFERMVSQWASKFEAHVKTRGVDPAQIGLLFVDEPERNQQFKVNAAYGRIVKAAAPGLKLFTDAAFIKSNASLKEMLESHDIVCPHLPKYGNSMNIVADCVNAASGKPKELNFYSCEGPGRMLDPYYYHRLQAWHCWRNNAVRMGFWCYWNYYRNPKLSAWNEIATPNVESFGVVYSTADSITTGKHWEAIREGVEDYEYLFMLKARLDELKAKGEKAAAVEEAEALLAELPAKVAGSYNSMSIPWSVEKERDAADQARILLLDALESLR